ncbi:delta-lactam-biosynthetic de-N-acetylase [Bacillaceae bacterium SIJ1]|uniref:delta-lactam-biosynthetic de-N-acetylase n=1 Tax=Litoribacterium kuwaitense TaxID=1398745 RepID=UPI0013EBE539|nr:delta-lactam-biosynthetic de-N-acetylase [Litoribacterium kuwaitense]NGP46035.1 delta-lactam-biosynthetic de-N-acetylase [Litoribacterium kuwaitense]
MKRWTAAFIVGLLFFSGTSLTKAADNTPIHWGFTKSKNETPAEAGQAYDELLKKHDAFYKDTDATEKNIYLTFDNGYENGYTAPILDVLKKTDTPATFFITGHYIKDQPELVKRMAAEGHIVGNHSWSHPDMTTVTKDKFAQELARVDEAFQDLTGGGPMKYLRPPRGIFSDQTLQWSGELGYYNVLWSVAFVDWKTDQQKGADYAYKEMMKQAHPGAVFLLHTVSKDNAEALERAITDLKKRGYTFASLDDYLLDHMMIDPLQI